MQNQRAHFTQQKMMNGVTTRESEVTGTAFTERARWSYGYNARGEVAAASASGTDVPAAGEQFGTAGASGAVSAAGFTYSRARCSMANSATWSANALNHEGWGLL